MANVSIKKATMINFISKYSNIFIQLIINSVLARLLTPDDFGVVAIITVFISFFTIIADMGIGPAIIQHKELTKKQISDIFIFTIFTAIAIAIGFVIFSFPLSIFYNNKVYIPLGSILSIGIFFNVLNIVPNAILLKEKQFKALGIRNVLISTVCGIITIILSINGAKYYALVVNSVLVALFTFVLNFYHSRIKIYKSFSIKSVNIIKQFSSYQFGFNFINYFSRNLDNLMIGKFLGEVPLGYYDKAYKLMLYPVQNLTNVITPVLHPILSEHQKDKEYVYDVYIKIIRLLSLVGLFFGVFCYFSAKEIMLIMFGSQWTKSIPAFTILSISIWPQVVTSSTGAIFQSLGETKALFKCGLITTTINITLIITGLILGKIEYVAAGVTVGYMISFIVAFSILIRKVFNKSFLKYLYVFIPHIIVAVIMSLPFLFIKLDINNIFISVIVKFIISVIFYLVGLVVTKEYKSFINIIRGR